MVNAVEEQLLILLSDDIDCIESFFYIPNKATMTVPMLLKPSQRAMLKNQRRRIIILKSSSVGSTSAWTAALSRRTMFSPNVTSVIMSHKGELSRHLFDRTTFFYLHLPREIQPILGGDSRNEKTFPALGSKMYIGTAGSTDFGRGEPIHNFLCSEWLFYTEDQYYRVIQPAMQRVPEYGQVILESTPNGENYGYELIQETIKGRTVWDLMVFYWFDDPENSLTPSSPLLLGLEDYQGELEYTAEEEHLIELHNLSQNQIRWRRYRIHEIGDMFFQEQVEDLSTCFLSVKDAFYDKVWVDELDNKVSKPVFSGDGVSVWEDPLPGIRYYMGVDPGQARRTESVAWIVREDWPELNAKESTIKCVAMIAGMYAPDRMGQKCIDLGEKYNGAVMNPEANGHGIAFVDAVKGRYKRLYLRRDVVKGIPTTHIGWNTNLNTKKYMMDELNRHLKGMDMPDQETLRQIRAWRYDDSDRLVTTAFDDRHDALGLALVCMPGSRRARGFKGSSGFTSWDRRQ